MNATVWRSKVDWWLPAILAGSAIVALVAIGSVAWNGQISLLSAVLVAAVAVGPLGWLLATTRYELSKDLLLVRSGPFAWRIAVADIVSVTPTRNPLSSPALSLDRLRIDYGKGRSIMISPNDKAAFLHALEAHREAAGAQPDRKVLGQ